MTTQPVFFGPLKRRAKYDAKTSGGNYHYAHYRPAIAEDCGLRCVYCDCHADEVGGYESMAIDHFRPYGRDEFSHLRDVPENLMLACGRCNGWKSDYWPTGDPTMSHNDKEGWIEPFQESRASFLQVTPDGTLKPLKPPAEYVIRMLHLNRTLMRRLRERRVLLNDLPKLVAVLEAKWQAIADGRAPGDAQATAREGIALIRLIKALQRTLGTEHLPKSPSHSGQTRN